MSHFYGSISNHTSKTVATRRGFKTSGMDAHIRGWDLGIRVECSHIDGKDVFRVYKTGGSNNSAGSLIATIEQ